jgi:hypothetical protein
MNVITCDDNGTLAVVREGKLDIYTLIGEADTPKDLTSGSVYTLLHSIGEPDSEARLYAWFSAL